jgi:CubicO group peptidase (beta-lactamase class C family)
MSIPRSLLFVLVSAIFCTRGLAAQPVPPKCESLQWPKQDWAKADATSMGIDAGALEALDADLKVGKYGYVDEMLVIRCGKVVTQARYKHDYQRIYGGQAKVKGPLTPTLNGAYNYFDPSWHPFYRGSDLHTLQSVTKTVASMVIGVAVTRKEFPSIDTPVLEFFDSKKVKNVDPRKRRMTIRHLLSMTSGLEWDEDVPYDDPKNNAVVMESLGDWIQYVINQPMAAEPGTRFNYNSGATQLLSHIFKKATGRDMQDYARQHLFTPLGIVNFYWKRAPKGLTDVEGGLYLRAEDLAKLGYLFLREGRWNEHQIVAAEWVTLSTTPRPTIWDGMQYGLKWWLPQAGTSVWAGHGFGGQRLVVLPALNLVVVFMAWNIPEAPRGAIDMTLHEALRLAEGLLATRVTTVQAPSTLRQEEEP